MKIEDSNILKVCMLGDFSMEWQGRTLSGAKTKDSQFTRIMEVLIHNGDRGVERRVLEELLDEDSSSYDISHMLRSVIYNAKKKLNEAGLPDVNYIEYKKGRYYWTEEIPVEEDAAEFEKYCELADEAYEQYEEAKDGQQEGQHPAELRKKAKELYLKACYAYTGDFLPNQTRLVWVTREAKRYKDLFFDVMDQAADMLREDKDFAEMEMLGKHATKISPLEDWETLTMEALASLERYEEARELYGRTVEYYMTELGIRPSDKMIGIFEKIADKINHPYALMDEVQDQLAEPECKPGGMICSFPVFQGLHYMAQRMIPRSGQSFFLMLCSIMDSKGQPMKDGVIQSRLSERLEDAIRVSIRHSDAFCRYGKGQYLILLLNTTQENCAIIQRRIDENFLSPNQCTGVQYFLSPVKATY